MSGEDNITPFSCRTDMNDAFNCHRFAWNVLSSITPVTHHIPQGKSSSEIEGLLGYLGSEEVVHRDNIGLLSLMERNRPANRHAALHPDKALDPDDTQCPTEAASAASQSQATVVERALDSEQGFERVAVATDVGSGVVSTAGNGVENSRAEEVVVSTAAAEPAVLFDVSERLAAIRCAS